MTHVYEIRIEGHLDERWQDWFDGLTVSQEEDGTTLLSGPVADQPALYGILRRVRDLGLPLVSVHLSSDNQNYSKKGKIKMNTNKKFDKTVSLLEDIKINIKVKLAAIWTAFMFLYIYVDYFHLYMPGSVEDILAGKVFTFDISYVFLLVAMIGVIIPVLMIFLSVALPAKVNRWTNIIIAAIYIPYMLFNLAGVAWVHMYLAAAVEVALLLLIIRYAWKWTRQGE